MRWRSPGGQHRRAGLFLSCSENAQRNLLPAGLRVFPATEPGALSQPLHPCPVHGPHAPKPLRLPPVPHCPHKLLPLPSAHPPGPGGSGHWVLGLGAQDGAGPMSSESHPSPPALIRTRLGPSVTSTRLVELWPGGFFYFFKSSAFSLC